MGERRSAFPTLAAAALSIVTFLFSAGSAQTTVFVEAESFATKGGWVVDQQFMDQMGSPFLMAHGLGTPVDNAEAEVSFSSSGTYHVYVRTRDWVPPYGPGEFSLWVNGTKVSDFGNEGDGSWAWHYGGTVSITGGTVDVELRDHTGFNGRCDAIVFSTTQQTPPNEVSALESYRRDKLGLPSTPPDAGEYDLVVVGGGFAGMCAAIAAAREGLRVALIQDRPVLGGNNSSEIRVHLGGATHQEPVPAVGDIVAELSPSSGGNAKPAANYKDEKKLAVVQAEPNIDLQLNMHAYKAEVSNNRIVAVHARHIETGQELRFPGALFADCSGDGNLGFMAGADYRMGREGKNETGESIAPETADDMHMGFSNMWYSEDAQSPVSFPVTPWALQFSEPYQATRGEWDWESGLNNHPFDESEYIRDHNFRAVYGVWSSYKNGASTASSVANKKLSWLAYVSGRRESRRLLGDVILKQQDLFTPVNYDDGCVVTTWGVDLHYPKTSASATCSPACEPFRTYYTSNKHSPYPVPYRCLYSRNVNNLFMAGRNISVTHVALGTVRVMRTTGMMGEVVGSAAALCRKFDCDPRAIYENHLDDLFKALGPTEYDVIVDDNDGQASGSWTQSAYDAGFYKDGYRHDGNSDKGGKSFTFSISVPADGKYETNLRWPAANNRATNVPVVITHSEGIDTVVVNMRENGSKWNTLGYYTFKASTPGSVKLINNGTNGYVVADAISLRQHDGAVNARRQVEPAARKSNTVRLHAGGSVMEITLPMALNGERGRLVLMDLRGRQLAAHKLFLNSAQQDIYTAMPTTARGAFVLAITDTKGKPIVSQRVTALK